MPNLFTGQVESPTTPGLLDATSSSSVSSSSQASRGSPLHRQSNRMSKGRGVSPKMDDADPIMCSRSEVGGNAGWTTSEQDQFISLVLPYIQGKRLSQEEIELIRSEAKQAHLPLECVDRLISENERQMQLVPLTKYQSEAFETIEDVDESDNILAYFSRMSTLKQGGHFPSLNTEAIHPFVEQNILDTTFEVEVDLDVGYVNKSFNIPLEETGILHEDSWDNSDDAISQGSTTIDSRNRYDTPDSDEPDAFESLLVGGVRAYEQEELDSIERERRRTSSCSSTQLEDETSTQTDSDWAPPTARPGKAYRYGYEHDLAEWRRKRDVALWQPSSNGSILTGSSFFACHAMAESVVAEELNGLLWGVRRPPRLKGITAVKSMVTQAQQRRKRRQERNQLRHIPDRDSDAPKPWHLRYRERCKGSPGYIGVDQYSLLDTASVMHTLDSRDSAPWESRDVRQQFLHERSISLSSNWFGRLRKENGNDAIKYRPCRPNAMGMPIFESEETVTDFDDCEWTDSPSKTTTSKSWKTTKKDGHNQEVNQTASISFTSGEGSDSHSDDGSTTVSRHTRSVYGQSTSRDGNSTYGNSTLFTEGNGSSRMTMRLDFGSMMNSMMTGQDTNTTYSNLRDRDDGVAWMSEDEDGLESAGVSAILDAEYDEDAWSKHRPETVTSATTDRYVSSFSDSSDESSTHSSNESSSTSNGTSTESSGSYCSSEDSESTSSGAWEDDRECGALVNVKPKLGERVSRVTPDHTSHLLRSRFRKKYLPRGVPLDK